jgi:hypothetical protein
VVGWPDCSSFQAHGVAATGPPRVAVVVGVVVDVGVGGRLGVVVGVPMIAAPAPNAIAVTASLTSAVRANRA